MLYELEPSVEISGGSWYKDGLIDTDLVEGLRESAYAYISNSGKAVTVDDVHRYLCSQGETNRGIDEVGSVVYTLELDNRVAVGRTASGAVSYSVKSQANLSVDYALQDIPCISCPVHSRCMPGGLVSPEGCKYLATWLKLDDNFDF